jgi:hypothetical protein
MTGAIPLDDRIFFVSLLNGAEFPGRPSKLPKPSTRSPGFSSWSVADGSESAGLLARSESAVARGGTGAVGELWAECVSDLWHESYFLFPSKKWRGTQHLAFISSIHSIGLERTVRLVQTARFKQYGLVKLILRQRIAAFSVPAG